MEAVGWISSVCFALCAMPQAWKVWQTRETKALSWGFLLLWLGGEVGGLAYAAHLESAPLLVNYLVNGCCLVIIIKEKWKNGF